jgi:hypothetical protein
MFLLLGRDNFHEQNLNIFDINNDAFFIFQLIWLEIVCWSIPSSSINYTRDQENCCIQQHRKCVTEVDIKMRVRFKKNCHFNDKKSWKWQRWKISANRAKLLNKNDNDTHKYIMQSKRLVCTEARINGVYQIKSREHWNEGDSYV